MTKKKAILIIMDGWGLGKKKSADAIQNAKTPFISSLYQKYPHSTLITFGEQVGLPEGQMGNSEVGHLNLGAGRIVYQELQRINKAIKTNELQKNPAWLATIDYVKKNKKALHLIGLVSNGGVHSHINHLKALCDSSLKEGVSQVFIHAFTDGRDCDPKSATQFIKELQAHIQNKPIHISTVIGRYYAMDRDKRWERIALAYNALVKGEGSQSNNILQSIEESYKKGITDEFLQPIIQPHPSLPSTIQPHDGVVFFNFRTDRGRELTQVLTQEDIPDFHMHTLPLYYTTMTRYNESFKNIHIMFEEDNLTHTLGEVIENVGYKQIRIAETEKYPHVTFFFSGGREKEFKGEKRILVNSPKVATYDLQPSMSAYEITEKLLVEITNETADFICLNYANTDMVGHTGVFSAAVKAVETVDTCVEKVITTAIAHQYSIILTADHGNSDYMINEDGNPNTQHSMNLVPIFVIDSTYKGVVKDGKLADVAPTILTLMNLPIPKEMTGNILIQCNYLDAKL